MHARNADRTRFQSPLAQCSLAARSFQPLDIFSQQCVVLPGYVAAAGHTACHDHGHRFNAIINVAAAVMICARLVIIGPMSRRWVGSLAGTKTVLPGPGFGDLLTNR